jgi:hypothetical protein
MGTLGPLGFQRPDPSLAMQIPPRFLISAMLVMALSISSCVAAALGVVGGVVGVWVIEDFKKGSGEILISATPDRVFRAAEQTARALPDIRDLEVVGGSLRITWTDIHNVDYIVLVLIVPGSSEYATLRVYAAEHGVRGRADLAQALAEEIATKI